MARANKKNVQLRNRLEIAAAIVALLIAAAIYLSHATIPVLQPAGPVAASERHLIIIAFLLMLIVVIPVFSLTFWFAWHYRETNHKATYKPNWDHSRSAETIWWLIPSLLILVLSVITWHSSYALDPYKKLASSQKPLQVQVVALDWRWLFIYPQQHMASINQLYMPVNRPVTFQITADAPMNSFWIPQLGGQIYAMPGMNTQLNLMASRKGTFIGRSANISGKGFAGMQITAKAVSQADFTTWTKKAQAMPQLTDFAYDNLAQPTTDITPYTYSRPMAGLYETIINKYMTMDSSVSDQDMQSTNGNETMMHMEMN